MKKLSLNDVTEEFKMITPEIHLFYNKETGEFEHYNELFLDDTDIEKYKKNVWVASPTAQDINEYEIMMDFAKQISDAHLQHRLVVALSGKGAFRRFKEVCLNTGLIEAWYKFKHKEYIAIAKEWCNNAGLAYEV
ncbi:MAG: hypothetical protein LBI79_06135 [Nitrososphaerota archaeon]|jgi:hypothetical protein|nr:hypothetical protein [Nitrososphaerota archaeon]